MAISAWHFHETDTLGAYAIVTVVAMALGVVYGRMARRPLLQTALCLVALVTAHVMPGWLHRAGWAEPRMVALVWPLLWGLGLGGLIALIWAARDVLRRRGAYFAMVSLCAMLCMLTLFRVFVFTSMWVNQWPFRSMPRAIDTAAATVSDYHRAEGHTPDRGRFRALWLDRGADPELAAAYVCLDERTAAFVFPGRYARLMRFSVEGTNVLAWNVRLKPGTPLERTARYRAIMNDNASP